MNQNKSNKADSLLARSGQHGPRARRARQTVSAGAGIADHVDATVAAGDPISVQLPVTIPTGGTALPGSLVRTDRTASLLYRVPRTRNTPE